MRLALFSKIVDWQVRYSEWWIIKSGKDKWHYREESIIGKLLWKLAFLVSKKAN